MIDLSVILPAYEEGENLRWLLPELQQALATLGVEGEILVVDTEAPRDATPDVCTDLGVRYLPRQHGPSYGSAVRTGIAASRGARVLLMDADGSHRTGDVARLWAARHDRDLVIGSRYVPGGNTENPRVLIALSLLVNVVFRLALRLPCYDVSNSFRLYRGDQLRELHLASPDFDVVEEILVKLLVRRPNLRVLEVPITFAQRRAGVTKRDLLAFAVSYLHTLAALARMRYLGGDTGPAPVPGDAGVGPR